jgi:hypothetical protein
MPAGLSRRRDVNAALLKSDRVDWNTPANVIEAMCAFAGGQIGLDPCSNAQSIVNAAVEYRLDRGEDGLKLPWETPDYGLVFVNPPYGKEIKAWIQRCALYGAEGLDVVALVPARVDTQWFDICWRADQICFVRGRLTFLGAPHPAPFPSALVFWSQDQSRVGQFIAETAHLGHSVRP